MTPPKPIPLEEAQKRLLGSVSPLESEDVPADQANGRYLAEPLFARRTQPAADLSAMDGYAVREDDLAGPWTLIGESAAGHPFAGELEPGQCIRISTGALMPAGGGSVLLQENAERVGNELGLANADGPTPRHIRRKGFDFQHGDELLGAGALLNPARIALAISGGNVDLRVGRRPAVAIIDSGDELSDDPGTLAQHQIPASNGPMLAALAGPLCSSAKRIGPVSDTIDSLLEAFEQAGDANVIVTSGGASVGDHDLVHPALERWGAKIDFWRIAMKPGKPLMVAGKGQQLIIGLPGNPVSSYVTAFFFLLPVLRKLAGAIEPFPTELRLTLQGTLGATASRTEFVRARMAGQYVVPVNEQDSSALAALASSNCLIKRPAGSAPTADGELVECYQLQNGGIT